jgi:hypothetical protein
MVPRIVECVHGPLTVNETLRLTTLAYLHCAARRRLHVLSTLTMAGSLERLLYQGPVGGEIRSFGIVKESAHESLELRRER